MLKKIVSVTVLTLLPIIIVTSACNIQRVEAEPSNVIATYGPAYLEDVNGLLVLHVKGSPYEMGYQYGFLLKDSIQKPTQIQEVLDMLYSYEDLVNISQAMEPHIPQEYIQEMQGLADGANISYIDVFIPQMGIELLNYGAGWTGCSGFAVFGNAAIDGHLYHGRSFDAFVPPGEPTGLVIVYEPENGIPFVNVVLPGMIGVNAGMNKEGITVEVNISRSSDKTFDGMPLFLMLRKVLQYSNNLTEAINIICQTDRTIGYNIVLGDGKNLNAAVVEISDNYCKVFWAGDPAEDTQPHTSIPNAVRRTNHYVDPELAATQRSPYDPRVGWGWSWDRYEKLSQLILDNYGNIDAEMSIEFLRTPPVAWAAINLQSMVFDSTDIELWVADAAFSTPAYLREFVYLSYNDLFPEYSVALPIPTATGTGTATFSTSMGNITGLTAVTSTACGTRPGSSFPHGFFSFNVTNIPTGSCVTITITFPSPMPVGTQYLKCQGGVWVNCTSLLGDDDGDNVLTLTICDGGLGDADGLVNGIIVDPGGPAVSVVAPAASRASPTPPRPLNAPQLSVKYLSVNPQQTYANQPVTITTNVVNTGDEGGNYYLILKINGQVEQNKMVSVGPQGTQPVKFSVARAQPGTYTVDIAGQKGSFTILGAGDTSSATPTPGGIIAMLVVGSLIVVVSTLLIRDFRRRA